MKENLEKIKESVSQLEGQSGEVNIEVLAALAEKTGFSRLDNIIAMIGRKSEMVLNEIMSFLPTHKKVEAQMQSLLSAKAGKVKKSEASSEKRKAQEEELSKAKSELKSFKSENQLSDADIEDQLWSFGAIIMMVALTGVEMLISFISLQEYFDGMGVLIGVNGGLGIASSVLAMIAGQLLKINSRIRKEIQRVNNAPATSILSLPTWVKEHPSVRMENGDWKFKAASSNFFIIAFMIVSSVLTFLKFIEPLQDGNMMAWIVASLVVVVNLIGFVAYEFICYSGLNYPIRMKVDKYLRKISSIERKLQKSDGGTEEELKKIESQIQQLNESYKKNYDRIGDAQKEYASYEEYMSLCGEIVSLFEEKTGHRYDDRLRSKLLLPKCPKISVSNN